MLPSFLSPSRIFFFSCLAFVAGIFIDSAILHPERIESKELSAFYGKRVQFIGVIANDPRPKEKSLELFVLPEGFQEKAVLFAEKFSSWQRGDTVLVKGVLMAPPEFENFNTKGFLASQGVYGTMGKPEIKLLEEGNQGLLLSFKKKFREVLERFLSPPLGTLLGALVLGDQQEMTEEQKTMLNVTGLRHITAISGQHVVILLNMVFPLFLGLGFWRRQALLLSGLFIALFIIMTGGEPSAVRAGIMGSAFLVAQYFHRTEQALPVLVFAAALMLAFNPLLLRYDVGFQLSFLAVLGIIFSFSWFQHLLRKVPETLGLRDMLAMNFSAQLFVIPLLVSTFGSFSLVSPLTNILVLPIIPLVIGLGIAFLLLGAFVPALGFALSFPILLLLHYMTFIGEQFAKLPFASLPIEHLPLVLLAFAYIPIFFFIRRFQHHITFP